MASDSCISRCAGCGMSAGARECICQKLCRLLAITTGRGTKAIAQPGPVDDVVIRAFENVEE